jgi:hypothetical protein
MELLDCAFPSLAGITLTDDPHKAFEGVDYALLVGTKLFMVLAHLKVVNQGLREWREEICSLRMPISFPPKVRP